jgi:hypothetical protein
MRYSLFLVPLVAICLSACASGGTPVAQHTATTQTTSVNTASYLTPEQSSGLIILPDDTITRAQSRFLSGPRSTARDNNSPVASSADPTPAEIAPLLAQNLSP